MNETAADIYLLEDNVDDASPATRALRKNNIIYTFNQTKDIHECYKLDANVVKPIAFVGFVNTISNKGEHWLSQNQSPY